MPPGAKSFARAKAWYGDEMTSPESGTSTSAVVVGAMTDCFPQELPDAEVTSIAIEYGTYSVPEVLGAVRADNWLHQRGDLASALGRELKADMKERFFPAGDKWREMVWTRADQTIGWALKGLTGWLSDAGMTITTPDDDAARLRLRRALQRAPLFADLDATTLAAVERELTLIVLPGGTPLFRQGEAADAVYVVASGCLGVFRHDEGDAPRSPILIAEITPGNIVGEMSLLSHSQRTRSVAALRDSEVWRLARASFDALTAAASRGAAGADAQRRGAQRHGPGQAPRASRAPSPCCRPGPDVPAARFAVMLAERARPDRQPGPDAGRRIARPGAGMVRALRDGLVLRALSRRSRR